MKKIISLIIFSIFFFNPSFAEKYWSNKKDGPTNVKDAISFIHDLVLKNTPEGIDYVYHQLSGIWYSQNLGFVAINQTSYSSNIFKMRLIKAPKGLGVNLFLTEEQILNTYKTIKDHEGSIEGTIIQEGNNYIGYNKTWFSNSDGSYKYQTNKGEIFLYSNDQFIYERDAFTGSDGIAYPSEREFFNKISPRAYDILSELKRIDNSKDISDFEMGSGELGLWIYYDSKYNDSTKLLKQKFIHLGVNNSSSAGKIIRSLEDEKKNTMEYIQCFTDTGLFYFPKRELSKPTKTEKYKEICDPLKVNYFYFLLIKYQTFFYILCAVLLILISFFAIKIKNKIELKNHNKKNNKKFKTYSELKEFKRKIEEKQEKIEEAKLEKERKAEEAKKEKERKAEEAKNRAEERKLAKQKNDNIKSNDLDESYDNSITEKLKKLKKLYKNGILSKADFENAKNKLLK